jgi:hypothetical protein
VDIGNDLADWSQHSQHHCLFDFWRGGWSALLLWHARVDALGGKTPCWRFLIFIEGHSRMVSFQSLLKWFRMSARGRYCCKSLFALLIKNSPGCTRDFRVKMWGTSSPDDKLVSDLAKAAESTKIAARRSDRLMAGNYHRPISDFCNNIGTDATL